MLWRQFKDAGSFTIIFQFLWNPFIRPLILDNQRVFFNQDYFYLDTDKSQDGTLQYETLVFYLNQLCLLIRQRILGLLARYSILLNLISRLH